MREFLLIVLSMQLSGYQFSPGQWSCWFCSYQKSRKRDLRFEGRKGKWVNSGLQSTSVQVWDWQHLFHLCSMRLFWGAGLWRLSFIWDHCRTLIFQHNHSRASSSVAKARNMGIHSWKSEDMGSVAVGTPWTWGMRYCSSDTSSVRYLDSKQSLFCTVFPFLFLIWQICVNVYSCTIEVVTGKWEVLAAE